MDGYPLLTRLIHENLSVVMCFAYSRKPLVELMDDFEGDWKYLNTALFEISEQRAEKACLALALILRTLDDEQKCLTSTARFPLCGNLVMNDGSDEVLLLREVANKVIHSSHLEWNFSGPQPFLVCHATPEQIEKWKWVRAAVNVVALAAHCGDLMAQLGCPLPRG